MIDEKCAVAVVGFVHERACGIAFGVAFEPHAFFVLGFEPCLHRANNDGWDLAH